MGPTNLIIILKSIGTVFRMGDINDPRDDICKIKKLDKSLPSVQGKITSMPKSINVFHKESKEIISKVIHPDT